ncbi:hypothetical protein [Desertivirga xinjiangensis]|uniref:hypothetical protein n=1 Tax=Desertivirga xinjiangensis TaxID=539206 RepID=UPI00210AF27D|nr:hypothetical protein [Pedobacter xinjiangensis]
MKITLKKLTLINFMGVDKLTVDFSQLTKVFADNGVGKTRLFNAFTWLLFGKDSYDRTDFDIKNTVDRSKNKLDHEVTATLEVPGDVINLKRVHREKWSKKRGEEYPQMTGHEDEFFWNDVPLKKSDYTSKVGALLNEKLFRLLTNINYFNSQKPDDRRRILLDIAGKVDDRSIWDSITDNNNAHDISELMAIINAGKSADEYKLQIASQRRKLNEQKEKIPTRIDEVSRNMPEAIDLEETNKLITAVEARIVEVDTEMSNLSTAYQNSFKSIQDQQNKIHGLKSKLSEIEFLIKSENQSNENANRLTGSNILNTIENIERDLRSKSTLLSSTKERIASLHDRIENGRAIWREINASTVKFDDHEFTCPTCKRHIEPEDVEAKKLEMTNNFNTEKQRKLSENVATGKQLVAEFEEAKTLQETLTSAIGALNKQMDSAKIDLQAWNEVNSATKKDIQSVINENPECIRIKNEIKDIESQLPENPAIDLSDLKQKRATLVSELDIYKGKLKVNEVIESNKKRIEELEAEERKLSHEIAAYERTEFLLEKFSNVKMDIVEGRVNKMFKFVRFRLFDRQVNGAEVQVCDALLPNREKTGFVPWNSANTAARVNGGLDIINTLSDHYGVHVPIFIDAAESTTSYLPSKSQLIKLHVSESDKKLRIEQEESEMVA